MNAGLSNLTAAVAQFQLSIVASINNLTLDLEETRNELQHTKIELAHALWNISRISVHGIVSVFQAIYAHLLETML